MKELWVVAWIGLVLGAAQLALGGVADLFAPAPQPMRWVLAASRYAWLVALAKIVAGAGGVAFLLSAGSFARPPSSAARTRTRGRSARAPR